MNNTKTAILANNENENFIKLEQYKFSFKITSPDGVGKAEGYCDLTDEEYKVFLSVFNRIADSAKQIDQK